MARSLIPRLSDVIEAIDRINSVLVDVSLDAFENDWQRQWLVERGVAIISEASRHLPDELKARNPEIPWQKVAGIGNVTASQLRAHRRTGAVEACAGRSADIGKGLPF